MANKQFTKSRFRNSSALILTVVLTSLLAIVGVLFVLVSRLDKMSTSGLSENKELNYAAETVIAKISQELASDVPGANEEYYDYPDANNAWLACLEPNVDTKGTPATTDDVYYWPQISNITGTGAAWTNLQAGIIDDYQGPAEVNDSNISTYYRADADGDGVSDSVWAKIPAMTSSKGKPIYAAVRIVDNGGMLNVNTAYKFDPNDTEPNLIDGSSQMHINLCALAARGSTTNPAGKLDNVRFGSEPHILENYIEDVVWRYFNPNGAYTPFDIGDELELRNRFLINLPDIDSRIENIWTSAFKNLNLRTPVTSDLTDWFYRAQHDVIGPNDIYSYRHLATTYNMDRSINPRGSNMVNINTAVLDPSESLYDAIMNGFKDAGFTGSAASQKTAQIAVNLIDFADSNNTVTVLHFADGNDYYGFETQPFISEIGFMINGVEPDNPSNNYFALELYNPFDVNIPLDDFRLELRLAGVPKYTVNLAGSVAANSRFVITNSALASITFGIIANQIHSNLILATYTQSSFPPAPIDYAAENYDIYLLRDPNLYLDLQNTQNSWFDWSSSGTLGFFHRYDNNWNIVYQEMYQDPNNTGTLGGPNGGGPKKNYNIPSFAGGFTTVGDIARILTIGPSTDPCDMIGVQLAAEPLEKFVRLDLTDPNFQQLFNYLTIFPPVEYFPDPNETETRIKGRLNINTAPWFVIAQLPWVSDPTLLINDPNRYILAQEIVNYREKNGVFNSIGELMNVAGMDYYQAQTGDLLDFPDLTTPDNAADDFEERDVIFARISNLVTVRSDVFTAYILVRIGEDGPQKRAMAILDRSNVDSDTDKVRIIALHSVPDPR